MDLNIYQLKIELSGSKPKIWRRVLLPSNMEFEDLHYVIQMVMGWENGHLHQFRKDKLRYQLLDEEDEFLDNGETIDYSEMPISDLLIKEKDKIIYDYDFGDSWEHDVCLEKILAYDTSKKYPFCIKGKNACPPEDCGGIWGYYRILDVLKDPKHEDYSDYSEWYGDIDPEYFDVDDVNQELWEIV